MYLKITKKTKNGNFAVTIFEKTPIGNTKLDWGTFLTDNADESLVGKEFELASYKKIERALPADQETGEISTFTQILPSFK